MYPCHLKMTPYNMYDFAFVFFNSILCHKHSSILEWPLHFYLFGYIYLTSLSIDGLLGYFQIFSIKKTFSEWSCGSIRCTFVLGFKYGIVCQRSAFLKCWEKQIASQSLYPSFDTPRVCESVSSLPPLPTLNVTNL